MVVIGVLYIDVVGAAGSWRWLSVSCIALCVIWDGILRFAHSAKLKTVHVLYCINYLICIIIKLKHSLYHYFYVNANAVTGRSIALLSVPETPAFLLTKRDFDGARRSLEVMKPSK